MADERKRQRTESMIKLANQKKESKLWYEEANSHIKVGNLAKAIYSYNKALELNPTEKSALVARSKCYILLGQPENALKDAETALNIDKTYLRAIYQKAEALYYLGDFEHSLMYYHRGLHIRPDHEDFKLGVHKAQKAIENAIGSPNVFANLLTPKSTSKTSSPESTESGKTEQRTTPGSKVKSARKSRLLRELGPDKEYLDNLMKNPNLKCKFKEDDSSIIKTIEETVEYLNSRQEFWRQQLPAHLK
ncbi:outer dynein arm-docking complex subunit 4 isoform X2 [Tribolium madens]|uniref:outer dynein arm-docking complex subunit 4 isoform X2 n=1 Tax=Tribolium madens TaxID=41895 RepID=UPI001CF760F8|nr:outer dynein arm-docking complex subunit 4 isoform X2 [Tribolium madens]